MMSRTRDVLLLSGLTALAAHGQLYLLTASPIPAHPPDAQTYPSSLLRPDGEGGVTEVREIAPARPAVDWVGVSYDERMAVLVTEWVPGTPPTPEKIIVVDFDKADIVKSCDWPSGVGSSIIANWLAVQPGTGLSLEWHVVGKEPIKDDSVSGFLLDPSVPCEKSLWTPQSEDLRYVIAHGAVGMGGGASYDTQLDIAVSLKDGNGGVYAFTNHLVPLGYQVPADLRKGYSARLQCSNQDVFAMSLDGKIVFFRKSDKTWHERRVSTEHSPAIRGFGKYLVAAEMQVPRGGGPVSAGEKEWRPADSVSERGPATNAVGQGHAFTGRLLIYDTETEKEFSISTNQGDSEVLLIEGGVVYYRAATRLYSAPLTKDGVGQGRLLATSELIRDAHWAFIKH
jgi:hypothetical protein